MLIHRITARKSAVKFLFFPGDTNCLPHWAVFTMKRRAQLCSVCCASSVCDMPKSGTVTGKPIPTLVLFCQESWRDRGSASRPGDKALSTPHGEKAEGRNPHDRENSAALGRAGTGNGSYSAGGLEDKVMCFSEEALAIPKPLSSNSFLENSDACCCSDSVFSPAQAVCVTVFSEKSAHNHHSHPEWLAKAPARTLSAPVSQPSLFQKGRKQGNGIWGNTDTPLPELLQLMASRETVSPRLLCLSLHCIVLFNWQSAAASCSSCPAGLQPNHTVWVLLGKGPERGQG